MNAPQAVAVPTQYASAEQRDVANHIGMWTLIATEVLFFGGLFMAYIVYRFSYPHAFSDGSQRLDFWKGTVNTAILLSSSLSMALGDALIKRGKRGGLQVCLLLTAALGTLFLAVKFSEYFDMYRDHLVPGVRYASEGPPQMQLFIFLYFAMTGLHAVHMLIGIAVLLWLASLNHAGRLTGPNHAPVVMVGLYWHFVDCVWVFLYPLLYLVPHGR